MSSKRLLWYGTQGQHDTVSSQIDAYLIARASFFLTNPGCLVLQFTKPWRTTSLPAIRIMLAEALKLSSTQWLG